MEFETFFLEDNTFIRFKKIGKGQPILLLHTFRNRMEYSDKLGNLLKNKFTVYSIDLPGFGDSPINKNTIYNLGFFLLFVLFPANQYQKLHSFRVLIYQ